ncbi:helix-turn-helix domain-containing protein [Burkholderia cepacia]|uniref:helix-turn-helix domain-containing protein n=1 Tax=Burkholderia cepacia TaxID=292 RepID=UPI003EE3C109
MNIDETKITTYHTICTILLRELRVQRGYHRAQFADFFGKPASAWEGIETGKSRLDFDTLLRVCRGIMQPPGPVLLVTDAYERFLRTCGWSVVLADAGKDGLMTWAKEYWDTPGARFTDSSRPFVPTALNEPYLQNNIWFNLTPAIRFAVDEQFRAEQNDAERFKPLPSILDQPQAWPGAPNGSAEPRGTF